MAITSINKDFSKRTKDVNLLAKDFSSYRQRLVDFAKTYFPNTYNDFTDTSVGNMFVELVAYAGDVLSYNIDYNFKENLLTHASETKNILSLAQALGYKVNLSSGGVTSVKIYQLLPDNGSNAPDFTYALKLQSGMKISSENDSNVIFRTLEPVNFENIQYLSDKDEYISVFQEENGTPAFWLVEYNREVPVSAGTEKTLTYTVGDAQQFLTVELPESDVIEVTSVTDSDNNVYYEVDYLAQDSIIQSSEISNASEEPFFQPVIQRVPRRFVTKVNKNLKLQLQFGSGTTDSEDEDVILALEQANNLTQTSELAIDPNSFSTAKTYGKVPANTTLTIKYVTGGGVTSNVPQNDLINVSEVVYENDTTSLEPSEITRLNQIKTTLSVTNEEKATGGSGIPTPETIRENALQFFGSQKRCVTALDYKSRVLSMPTKFGRVTKAYAKKHDDITTEQSKATIDLYLLGVDTNNKLTNLNTQTKKNISTYLNEFRLLTDGVNLLDGYVINLGVDFSISTYKGYNQNDVLLESIEVIKDFFNIRNQDFNTPIFLSDLELQIANVDGVRTVNNVELRNITSTNGTYSDKFYPVQSAIKNKTLYPSIEPSVFEVKFPNQDIRGKVE